MKKFSLAVAAAAMSLACAPQASAIALTFATGVSDYSTSSIGTCASPFTGDVYHNCVTTGFISDQCRG
jgi:hypothetical protein